MATLAVTSLQAFIEVILNAGLDLKRLCQRVEMDYQALENKDEQLDLSLVMALLDLARKESDNEFIGMDAGDSIHPADWGVLSFVMMNSATLGEALQNTIHYENLVNKGIKTEIKIVGGWVHNTVAFPGYSDDELLRPLVERDFSAVLKCAEFLSKTAGVGRNNVASVSFRHSPPVDNNSMDGYLGAFGCKPVFNAGSNTLVYHSSILELPVLTATPNLMPALIQHLDSISQHQYGNGGFSNTVANMLRESLGHGVVSRGEVADRLNMSVSTLKRRLREDGTSYRDVFDKVRMNVAEDSFREGDMPVTDLAFILGFSSVSAFSSAFKKWTGLSPKRYKLRRDTG